MDKGAIDELRSLNRQRQEAQVAARQRPAPTRAEGRDRTTGLWGVSAPDGSTEPNAEKLSNSQPGEGDLVVEGTNNSKILGPVAEEPPLQQERESIIYRPHYAHAPLKDNNVGYIRGQVWSYPGEEEVEIGAIAYLYSVYRDGSLVVYVGGLNPKPEKVLELSDSASILATSIDNLGRGKWRADLCYQVGAARSWQRINSDPASEDNFVEPVVEVPSFYGHSFASLGTETVSSSGSDTGFVSDGIPGPGATITTTRLASSRVERNNLYRFQGRALSAPASTETNDSSLRVDVFPSGEGGTQSQSISTDSSLEEISRSYLTPQLIVESRLNQSTRTYGQSYIVAGEVTGATESVNEQRTSTTYQLLRYNAQTKTAIGRVVEATRTNSGGSIVTNSRPVSVWIKADTDLIENLSDLGFDPGAYWLDVGSKSWSGVKRADLQKLILAGLTPGNTDQRKSPFKITIDLYSWRGARLRSTQARVYQPSEPGAYSLLSASYNAKK